MGAQEKSPVASNSMQRVKVYRMNDDSKWDDQGTGHVTVDYVERSEEFGLFVIDEEDNETLLVHRISSDDIYRKQEDTIISWRDPEYSTELALSFQETTGCSYIWDQICDVQRNMHFSSLTSLEPGSCPANDASDASGVTQLNGSFRTSMKDHSITSVLRELPAVELSTLPQILKIITESGIADQMRVTELILNDQEFFRKLMDLLRICEDLENLDGLHVIYKIVRGIILLNSPQIFERIFGDELIMDIIGSLEYDVDVPQVQQHRNFLKEHVFFKEAIPIKNPLVLSKIHQTYRVGYLKDVVLPRVLDEATSASLNSIIHTNNAIVVSLLKDDSTFIQELFAKLKSSTTSAESKKNLVFFLHEFCSLSKSLQMVQQLRLFRDLMNEGIFDIISDTLQSEDKRLVLTGTDILILFLSQDANLLRSYVTRAEGTPLLGLLVKGMITDFGEDMHCQFLEILRSLLDSYASGPQRDSIIEIFYDKHLGQLIDIITSSCPVEGAAHSVIKSTGVGESAKSSTAVKPEILLNICELLCYCVLHHPYRIKCNFLLNNVIDKVLFLTRRREKYLVVAAVRFVRTIVSRSDEHITSHMVKNNLLKPIVDVFLANDNRYNLLNSAVLDLFEYIRKDNNMKPLVKYLVDSFWSELVKFEHFSAVENLKLKYEQGLDNSVTKSTSNMSDSRKRADERALEKEEEDYFNEDSDEEDTTSVSISRTQRGQAQPVLSNGVTAKSSSILLRPRTGGLVDYDDDEDDEDYKPPPKKQSETSEDVDGTMESLRLKRSSASKSEPGPIKKQRLDRNPKSKDSVFAALCSTLSQAVLPSKKTTSAPIQIIPRTRDPNKPLEDKINQDKVQDASKSRSVESSSPHDGGSHKENGPDAIVIRSDCLDNSLDNGKLDGEEPSLLPPKSSPEMAVNGS